MNDMLITSTSAIDWFVPSPKFLSTYYHFIVHCHHSQVWLYMHTRENRPQVGSRQKDSSFCSKAVSEWTAQHFTPAHVDSPIHAVKFWLHIVSLCSQPLCEVSMAAPWNKVLPRCATSDVNNNFWFTQFAFNIYNHWKRYYYFILAIPRNIDDKR